MAETSPSAEPPAKAAPTASPKVLDSTAVLAVRGERILLDFQLAAIFEVETRVFNQAIKRNLARFPRAWAFQLTVDEAASLTSQIVISSDAWGGRRKLPWAFTEHGVVMAASMLRSERAIAVMQLVVEVFVRARRGEMASKALATAATRPGPAGAVSQRLQSMIERLMQTVVDHESQQTVRDEAMAVFQQSIDHIKSRLGKAGFENEEIAARATKLLSEAEINKASAAKIRAEADEIAVKTLAKKLRMVLEAEQAMARGEMEGFLKVLDGLGKA